MFTGQHAEAETVSELYLLKLHARAAEAFPVGAVKFAPGRAASEFKLI